MSTNVEQLAEAIRRLDGGNRWRAGRLADDLAVEFEFTPRERPTVAPVSSRDAEAIAKVLAVIRAYDAGTTEGFITAAQALSRIRTALTPEEEK